MSRRIVLIGALDLPVGGVSSHVRRLATAIRADGGVVEVIDPYPGKPPASDIQHVVTKRGGAAGLLEAATLARSAQADVVHLHFSRAAGKFIPMVLLLAGKGKPLAVTLHHGDLAGALQRAPAPLRAATRYAMNKVDRFIALSPAQADFYAAEGFGGRTVRLDSRLPVGVAPDPQRLPADVRAALDAAHAAGERVLVASGFPTPIYRHGEAVELLRRAMDRAPTRLFLCLYGPGDEEPGLRRAAKGLPVTFTHELPPAAFLAILAKADLLVRPTAVDSWGLAVSDALDMGAAALASDVCARDPRARTYPADDRDAFFRIGLEMVAQGRPASTAQAAGVTGLVDALYGGLRTAGL